MSEVYLSPDTPNKEIMGPQNGSCNDDVTNWVPILPSIRYTRTRRTAPAAL